jgi:hypothetical protein
MVAAQKSSTLPMSVPSLLQNIPIDREARWQLLKDVIADWYPPLSDMGGVDEEAIARAEQELGFALPLALKEWYSLAGRRADIWSRQDELILPHELAPYRHSLLHSNLLNPQARQSCENVLVFYVENQICELWGIQLDPVAMDDPPVVIDPGNWRVNSQSVSEFALQMFVTCIKWGDPLRWLHGPIELALLTCIEANFPKLDFAEWWYWGRGLFYGFRDVVIEVIAVSETDARVFVSARTEEAFESFTQFISDDNFYCDASWEDCA